MKHIFSIGLLAMAVVTGVYADTASAARDDQAAGEPYYCKRYSETQSREYNLAKKAYCEGRSQGTAAVRNIPDGATERRWGWGFLDRLRFWRGDND